MESDYDSGKNGGYMMDIFKRIFRRKDPEVRHLIRELNNSVALQIKNKRIPTIEAVRALGETYDPDAFPALIKAWKRALDLEVMLKDFVFAIKSGLSEEQRKLALTYAKQVKGESWEASKKCNPSLKDK